jgi:hypothetical protein
MAVHPLSSMHVGTTQGLLGSRRCFLRRTSRSSGKPSRLSTPIKSLGLFQKVCLRTLPLLPFSSLESDSRR